MENDPFADCEVVYSYTLKEAVADGRKAEFS